MPDATPQPFVSPSPSVLPPPASPAAAVAPVVPLPILTPASPAVVAAGALAPAPSAAAASVAGPEPRKLSLAWWGKAIGVGMAAIALLGAAGKCGADLIDRLDKTALAKMDSETQARLVTKLAPAVADTVKARVTTDVITAADKRWYSESQGNALGEKVDGLEDGLSRVDSALGGLRVGIQQEVGMLRQQVQTMGGTVQRLEGRSADVAKVSTANAAKLDFMIEMMKARAEGRGKD